MKNETAECLATMKYMEDFLYVIRGKWKVLIILAILEGNERFRDIMRAVPNITAKMLSKELKEMEMNKLITRNEYSDFSVTVKYELTDYSKTLAPITHMMVDWGMKHREALKS